MQKTNLSFQTISVCEFQVCDIKKVLLNRCNLSHIHNLYMHQLFIYLEVVYNAYFPHVWSDVNVANEQNNKRVPIVIVTQCIIGLKSYGLRTKFNDQYNDNIQPL